MRHKQRLYALTLRAHLHDRKHGKPIPNAKRVIHAIKRDNLIFRANAIRHHSSVYYALAAKRHLFLATLTPITLHRELRSI